MKTKQRPLFPLAGESLMGVGVALYDARAMFTAFLTPTRAMLGK